MTDRSDGPEPRQQAPGGADDAPARGLPASGDRLASLDDVDSAVYTIGQAAELLGVDVTALRRLDEAGAISPGRSAGRQRRYSRRQLHLARRVLVLVGEGTPIVAAGRIAALETEVSELRTRLDDAPGS
jgi:excisionase family DNA binding protein